MLCDVVHILLKLRIVLQIATLVKVGDVDEVPVGLPAASLVLNLVSECSTLHERVMFSLLVIVWPANVERIFSAPARALGFSFSKIS